MAISNKLNKLKETKESIKEAIESKGVSVLNTDTFSSYADKIKNIQSVGATTETDWWDIETILKSDTEDCTSKIICLLTDELDDKSTINTAMGAYKYILSDGQILTATSTKSIDITNIFDTSKDKVCSKGYKTRYIIYCINDEVTSNIRLPNNTIYTIFNNVKFSSTSTFTSKRLLQAIKFLNDTKFVGTSTTSMFSNCISLKEIPNFDTSNVTTMGSMFSFCRSLRKIPNFNTSNVTNMYRMFNDCTALKEIPDFDTSNVTNMASMFENCSSLKEISKLDVRNVINMENMFKNCCLLKEIPLFNVNNENNKMNSFVYGCSMLINIGGINRVSANINVSLSIYLNHLSLLKILYGLIDLSNSTPISLSLGSTNLSKLTDEEKAIATNKNWTLS